MLPPPDRGYATVLARCHRVGFKLCQDIVQMTQRVAAGALLMVLFKFLERSLGLISTLILARSTKGVKSVRNALVVRP